MARATGILGQASPTANTDTAPARNEAHIRVLVANRDSSPATIRIWISVEGASTDSSQYIAYDETIAANEALTTIEVWISPRDIVRVRASSSNVSFTCTGI